MEIKALIVDDEPLARNVILEYSKKIATLSIVGECSDAIQAHNVLTSLDVDLLFLDINMPKISGIDFLKSTQHAPLVVITTAYSEYALEGYELSVIDYLKKPFSFERFCKAIFKAEEIMKLKSDSANNKLNQTPDSDFLFIKSDKKLIKIKLIDICYVEGLGDYIIIHTTTQKIVSNISMKKILESLPKRQFCRIHKSYIIALNKIESIEGNLVKINSSKLPVGNNFKTAFFQLIQNHSLE